MVVFLTVNICRKLRISVISSSQWNISLVSIFWVIWRKVMYTREAPNFGGLHKNMNCVFPLNTKWKDCKSCKNLCTQNFMYIKPFYVHEIATVNLSKNYFLKNAKKSCKPNNLNRNWKIPKNEKSSRCKFVLY